MPERFPVTAILLNYARPQHMDRIIRELREKPYIDRIVVWDNSEQKVAARSDNFKFSVHVKDGVTWYNSSKNIFTLGRYVAATMQRDADLLWFQDDDIINPHIDGLYALACEDETDSMIVGLPDDASSAHYLWYEVNEPPETDIGYGCFARRRWISPCFRLWSQAYPNDSYLACRKADKIFTVLHGRRKLVRTPVERLCDERGHESGRDEHALWLRPDHKRLDEEVIRKCQRLMSKIQSERIDSLL